MAKGHKHHHHGKGKKGGGRIGLVASGNPDVLEEAHEDKDGEETGHERKHGGKVKKAKKHHRHEMEGKEPKKRMDRPGRKRGGAVGANTSPLSTAHKAGHGTDGSSDPKDTYGGTPA